MSSAIVNWRDRCWGFVHGEARMCCVKAKNHDGDCAYYCFKKRDGSEGYSVSDYANTCFLPKGHDGECGWKR